MEKLLLVDPNFSSDPISDELLDMGYIIFRIGKNHRTKRKSSNEIFIDIDYSNKEALFKFCLDKKIMQIIPGCTDKSFEISSQLGRLLNFSGYRSRKHLKHLHNKKDLYIFLKQNNFPYPKTYFNSNLLDIDLEESSNWILKPEIGFSGQDVYLLESKDELTRKKLQKYFNLTNKKFLIQEYIEGQLYSFTSILKNNKIVYSQIILEKCKLNSWKVNLSYIDILFPTSIQIQLNNFVEKIAFLTGKINGLIHLQFILSKNGPKIIEIIERMPGDLYSLLIKYSTNFNYVQGYLSNYLETDSGIKSSLIYGNNIVRITTKEELFTNFLNSTEFNGRILTYFQVYRHNNTYDNNEIILFLEFENFDDLLFWVNSNSPNLLVNY